MDLQNDFYKENIINTDLNSTTKSKNTNSFLNNKTNVLMFSSFDQKNATLIQLINTYVQNKKFSRLIDVGMLKDKARLFQVVYETLSDHKCRLFLLIDDFSSIKYFVQGLDIAGKHANIQILSNSKNLIHNTLKDFSDKLSSALINIGITGTQAHLDNTNDAKVKGTHFDSYRLGQIINKFDALDEVVEYADGLVADLSVIRQSDLPGKLPVGSSGIPIEMFNQIMVAAGRSKHNRFTIITGVDHVDLLDPVSVDSLAQAVYYYFTGMQQMTETTDTETVFVVEEASPYENIHFYKSELTNQWSVLYPYNLKDGFKRYGKIPCTYDDYVLCSKGDIPPRIHDVFMWLDSFRQ